MSSKSRQNCRKFGSSFQSNSVQNITFKIGDLKRDVDSVKTTYECGSDPNKPRIERVLSNMKRKIIKAEQIMKFGQNITQDRTRMLIGRVGTIKSLFKELMKDQLVIAKPDRRALCQMYHQLLSMEDDLVHFTDPAHEHSGSTNCKNNEEPPFTTIKDCEVQTNANEGCPSPCNTKTVSPCKSAPKNKPFVYTGIGFSRPAIELSDLSNSSFEETWETVSSVISEQHALHSSQGDSVSKPEVCSADAKDSQISLDMTADN